MSNTYYTQEQIDAQGRLIGEVIGGVSNDLVEFVRSSSISYAEREKLASLESSKFLGTFLTSEDIPVENAIAGSYADVDSGPESNVERWIFDTDSLTFIRSTSSVGGETSASIKEKYEANANTNAFTDADKQKLDGITAGESYDVAENTNDFKTAFANQMNSSSV